MPNFLKNRFVLLSNAASEGMLVPPSGFIFLIEVENGLTYYLTDPDGYYLVEAL